MSRILLKLMVSLFWIVAGYSSLQATTRMFAALSMTKDQANSSLPTDAGLFTFDSATGSWTRFGPQIQFIYSMVVDPSNNDRIFLACGNGIVLSRDGGSTWRQVSGWRENEVLEIVIDPDDSRNVYAATAWGLHLSRDGGDSWSYANDGLGEPFSKAIEIDFSNTSRLLVGTASGVFESPDRGTTWTRAGDFPEVNTVDLTQDPRNPNIWLAATEGKGAYLSTDGGAVWVSAVDAMSSANVYGVDIDALDSDRMAAAGWESGVHISTDGGLSWMDRSAGLPSRNVTDLIFDAVHPGRLWASTFEEGTYTTDDLGENWHPANLNGAYVYDLGFVDIPQTTSAFLLDAYSFGDDWYYLDGLETIYWLPSTKWVFLPQHGWWFPLGADFSEGLWFFDFEMGWLWSNSSNYPYLHSNSSGQYLLYWTDSTDPRYFFDFSINDWAPFKLSGFGD